MSPPPAKVRLPSAEDARAGTLAQYALLVEALDALGDSDFKAPTRLGRWTVKHLAAHLAATLDAVPRAFAKPPPKKAEADLLTYLGAARGVADAVATRVDELAKGATAKQLRTRLRTALADAEQALDGADPDRLMLVRLGALPLAEFLATRCVEGVVHGLDLRAAVGVPERPDPVALKVVVRSFAALLAHTVPGKSVEVRVPGHVAVQCASGPRHTRGTPANVVEADPEAFVEVCSGRISWANATARGTVRASGDRADLSPYLPLIG
jgi:uncharacterized protein (TIGR03083 family)